MLAIPTKFLIRELLSNEYLNALTHPYTGVGHSFCSDHNYYYYYNGH